MFRENTSPRALGPRYRMMQSIQRPVILTFARQGAAPTSRASAAARHNVARDSASISSMGFTFEFPNTVRSSPHSS